MLKARVDAHPFLVLPEATVRVHESRLLLETPQSAALLSYQPRRWRWKRSALALQSGKLAVSQDSHGDLDLARLPASLSVHVCATAPGRGRSLRRLLQELSVPLWEREYLPLLYAGGALLAVRDLWLHPDIEARPDSRSRGRIVWRPQR
jgi:tRNA(Ile)-lysidine synthase